MKNLQRFINSASKIVSITNVDYRNPFLLKLTNGVLGNETKYSVMVSAVEPLHVFVPINTVWLNFDSMSTYYKKALRLVGRNGVIDPAATVDPASVITGSGFTHVWAPVSTYAGLFMHESIYGAAGPAGEVGPQGPQGPQGPEGPIDYLAIVSESITQYNLANP